MKRLLPIALLLFVASNAAAGGEQDNALNELIQLVGSVDDQQLQLDLLKGVHEALRGRKRAEPPESWSATYKKLLATDSPKLRREAATLALIFEDPRAREQLTRLAADSKANVDERRWAVQTLVEHSVPNLAPLLHQLLSVRPLRAEALQGLARYRHPATTGKLLELYQELNTVEKQLAISALSARPDYAESLVAAIRDDRIPSRDVSSFHVRQIRSFGDQRLNASLEELWGKVGGSSKEKRKQIQQFKRRLNERALERGDIKSGQLIFKRVCASCHRLYGDGGAIGPDLTGSNRDNLDYVLENVLDPSAAVAKDYRLTSIQLEGGQVLSGIARRRSNKVIELQTPTEKRLIPIDEISERKVLPTSMMPDGLFDKLSFEDVRDLVVFLKTKQPPQ